MKKITLLFSFLLCSFAFSQSTANYTITVSTIWNATDHTSIPNDPHWSPLAGATHKNANDILEFNVPAPLTNGIKNIAETGNTTNFQNEIAANSDADQYLQDGFSPRQAEGSIAEVNVTISELFPYVTLVSMVAPSPDWFIAVNSENLRSGNNAVNNGWKSTYTIDMFAYDSGTDDGTDYESSNSASNPRMPISMITGTPINGKRMGTMTFTYNSSTLSTNTANTVENLKIFPNPTKGQISISNSQNINVKSVEIYNVLGTLLKQISIKQNTSKINLNLSELNSGIYLLSVLDDSGASLTKKLVIE